MDEKGGVLNGIIIRLINWLQRGIKECKAEKRQPCEMFRQVISRVSHPSAIIARAYPSSYCTPSYYAPEVC
jgi:hypothetical protein